VPAEDEEGTNERRSAFLGSWPRRAAVRRSCGRLGLWRWPPSGQAGSSRVGFKEPLNHRAFVHRFGLKEPKEDPQFRFRREPDQFLLQESQDGRHDPEDAEPAAVSHPEVYEGLGGDNQGIVLV
jgi:hypothetical protein